jgi:hypothetical protein
MIRIVFEEPDGNGVGIYEDGPVPLIGDLIESEGQRFKVRSVIVSYAADGHVASVVVDRVKESVVPRRIR